MDLLNHQTYAHRVAFKVMDFIDIPETAINRRHGRNWGDFKCMEGHKKWIVASSSNNVGFAVVVGFVEGLCGSFPELLLSFSFDLDGDISNFGSCNVTDA